VLQREKLQKLVLDSRPDVVAINARVGYDAKRMQMRMGERVLPPP
jgi:hypothetical protein